MNIRFAIAALLVIGAADLADAQPVKKTFRAEQKYALAPGGALVLENPVGNIDIVGTEGADIAATITTTITGANADAVAEGHKQTTVIVGGDARTRVLRTNIAPARSSEWAASVAWIIRMPRTAHVRVISRASEHVRVSGMQANVQIKNFNGRVVLENDPGAVLVDSVNGSITYTNAQPRANVVLSTVNGDVIASVARDADFRWVAETVKGDIRTTMPARGAFFGATFRGNVNAPGGPTLTTATLMGNVTLVERGVSLTKAKSLRDLPPTAIQRTGATFGPSNAPMPQQTTRGLFRYATNLGDVRVQEIRGDADIFTGAGEVQLGAVNGTCNVKSLGGPLQLGEIMGVLTASTRAGDILVDSARRGGTLVTTGGTIRVLYTSGPTDLVSGGGDITVRQAAAPINARTRSGDIFLTMDSSASTQKVNARSDKGNIVLNVHPQFAADIDATILTSDPDADTILSDVGGLSISKEEVGKKTRVHATGKINGGGQRVVLQVTDGDIRIAIAPAAPTIVRP